MYISDGASYWFIAFQLQTRSVACSEITGPHSGIIFAAVVMLSFVSRGHGRDSGEWRCSLPGSKVPLWWGELLHGAGLLQCLAPVASTVSLAPSPAHREAVSTQPPVLHWVTSQWSVAGEPLSISDLPPVWWLCVEFIGVTPLSEQLP